MLVRIANREDPDLCLHRLFKRLEVGMITSLCSKCMTSAGQTENQLVGKSLSHVIMAK